MVNRIAEIPSVRITGIKVSLCDKAGLLDALEQRISGKIRTLVLSANVNFLNLAFERKWLRDYINAADIVRLDGEGIRWGAYILGCKTPRRMTWADLVWDFALWAAENKYRLFFLGNKPGIPEKAAERLTSYAPGLIVAGLHHGFFNKDGNSVENSKVIAQINAAKVDILVIGFGMPLQEKWLKENSDRINATALITGGAIFEWISGEQQRAPQWMLDHGLEWLSRLIHEPKRLWKRYIIGNPRFILRVMKEKLGLLK